MELTKHKKYKLKLQQEFMNETIADKKDKNDEIFWKYFNYQNQSFLAKDLIRAMPTENEQSVNNVNGLIDLRKTVITK